MLKRLFPVTISILFTACSNPPQFNWSPEIYYGDSKTQSIQGSTENIKTNDSRFDEMICMSKDQPEIVLKEVNKIIEKCEVWKK